jgi:uncharacterized protein
MKVIRYHNPAEFSQRALPMLLRDEAVNNWTIGLICDLCSGVRKVPAADLLMCAIEDDAEQIIATATSMGESLVLTRMNGEAMAELAAFLEKGAISLPKTSGPIDTVSQFKEMWAKRAALEAEVSLRAMIMRLRAVIKPVGIGGALRLALPEEVDALTPWAEGFCSELGMDASNARENVLTRIERKRLYVWCDPKPVSMAATAGPTPNGTRINFVYTPTEFRRRGYARACVAALSQLTIDAGKQFVFLYVDLGNPTTNRLYREIGYEPVCEWADYRFVGN